ncbi:MAG: family oxidoreductase [Armatimonadetes bacterium]|jgi:NAD(P)-dependent dehydrogenase (short-subunit alcohol dehydrogenase family)|nr:family oxidoreductase [Armatimonadota bacterium]
MDVELIPGKVALVTGSSRGLGRTIARRLAIAGADIVLHDVDASQASRFGEFKGPEEVVADIESLGRRCAIFYGDITSREATDRIAREALAHFGRVDILVNCAGGDIGASGGKPVPNDCVDVPDEDLRVVLDRNLVSTMNMSRSLAHHMMDRGDGSIINIASLAGLLACPEGSIYAVAKAGVIHWTSCLAAQLRPSGINVNCISPGQTQTARFLATRFVDPALLENQGRLTRLGQPEDIARVVLFLASDLAAYVTGQNIVVNGGNMA